MDYTICKILLALALLGGLSCLELEPEASLDSVEDYYDDDRASFPKLSECNTARCTNYTSSNSSVGFRNVFLCCDIYNRCCDKSGQVKCPDAVSWPDENECLPFGPFCQVDDDCSIGLKCCGSTDTSVRQKCCWRPSKGYNG